jgi:hypothetical protein
MADERLVAAVNYLIDTADYSALSQEMTRALEGGATPLYTGKRACLNTLVAGGKRSRDAFENVLKLVERKRMDNPKVSKREYQKVIMRERRKRMAKALLLHEARRGPLKAADRTGEMTAIRLRWDRAKAEFLATRETMSGAERLVAIKEFWANVDRELDANIANLQKTRAVA